MEKETHTSCVSTEALDNAGHQISNYYEIADADPKALNGNGEVKKDSSIRISNLRESEV